jgi:hypothetical protein
MVAWIRTRKGSAKSMTPEQATPGMRVRVMEHHRVEERRGLVGKVVARYGGEEYVAVNVRLADGQYRLFWPRDLEEISSPRGLLEAGVPYSGLLLGVLVAVAMLMGGVLFGVLGSLRASEGGWLLGARRG